MQQLRFSLLEHQKQGVAKCFEREDEYGIVFLWVDPGLGKTLHLLAVATAKRNETLEVKIPCPTILLKPSSTTPEHDSNERETTQVERILKNVRLIAQRRRLINTQKTHVRDDYILNSRAVLVVCPKSSLKVWKKEIAKHVVSDSVVVVTLQTSTETIDLAVLSHADFVLITYDLLLSAFRRVPGAEVDLNRQQWTERHRSPFDETIDYDVETQHALEPILSLKDAIDCSSIALLYALRFERVVFDEAHNVRTLASKKYRACVRLCARYRWAMTGSALQNEDVQETYCAFRLLHVPNLPSFAVWRSSLAPSKDLSRKRERRRAFERRERQRYAQIVTANRHEFVRANQNTDDMVGTASTQTTTTISSLPSNLNDLFTENTSHEFNASEFARGVIEQMAVICKVEDIDADQDSVFRALMPHGFPDCVETIVRGRFRHEQERQFYLSFRDQLNRTTLRMVEKKQAVADTTRSSAITTSSSPIKCEEASLSAERVLSCSVMRLRQAAIAGALVMSRRLCLSEDQEEQQNRIVEEEKDDSLHHNTSSVTMPQANEGDVPDDQNLGERDKEKQDSRPVQFVLSREKTPWAFESSTKMLMFRNYVQRMCVEQSNKVLVFSHFLGSLDLCGNILDELGVCFVRVDGSVDSESRHRYIKRFQREHSLLVFLIVVKAMGESVDGLQVNCNRVLFLDPWFNPEVEQQALRRVLRMGQRQSKVFVTRLVVQGTFEERVVNIAASKNNLLSRVCSGNLGHIDGSAARRWTAGDVRDRLLYDEEGFVLQPTIQTDGEQDKEQQTTASAITTRRSSARSCSSIVSRATTVSECSSGLSFDDAFSDIDDDGEDNTVDSVCKRRRRDSEHESSAVLLSQQQLEEFEEWCRTSLFYVHRLEMSFFGCTPLLFKRAHVAYDTLRSAVLFSDSHETLVASRAQRFDQTLRLEWTFAGEDPSVWSSGFKLHVMNESILVSFIERERAVTDHHDPRRIGLLNNLIDSLRRHRDPSTKLWARAEPTFPPFEAFCALVPEYEKACAASFIHGWFWENQTMQNDVPFVVLYKPQRFVAPL